jgi:type I restriction enzyme M protein
MTPYCSSTRHLYRQIDRAHRDFLPEHIEFLANIARLDRGEDLETVDGSDALVKKHFPDGATPTCPGCAKSQPAPISRPKVGASTGPLR